MNQDFVANHIACVAPHPLKEPLKAVGLSQMHAARLINRSPQYFFERINGFKALLPQEEAALTDAIARAEALRAGGGE